MSTRRRPLGHGPVPLREDQEPRVVRGRTAAERAVEDPTPAAPLEVEPLTARRALGFGLGPRT
ncbi:MULTISPECIES: hypothetical protein [unclassified Streptomyces]|uniref:hypothetical protein n=1 Tax=unclassified Streptomyces TaxID=2593676 RepID=UPI002E2E41A8|nr:hypothetical protein [Streptomyces sp. NBC_01439]